MKKRIAGAIAVAALIGAVLIGCSEGGSGDTTNPEPARTFGTSAYVTYVEVNGVNVPCVVYRESISCDFRG